MATPAAVAARESSLVRAIGVVGLAAGILNIIIGGGIFRLPADVARALGPAAPLAYVACALAMGLIVLCFAEAGSRVDLTGGPYAYVEIAFGPFAGFLAGVFLWITGAFATSAVAVVFTANVGQLVPAITGGAGRVVFLVALFAALTAVHVGGVRQGTAVNTVATIAKVVPLLVLAIAGPFFIEPSNLTWPGLPPAGAVSRTSILLVFAFAGMECALTPSGEVKDVARTVPRAILLAMAAATGLYIALQLVAQGVLGPALASSEAPLAEAGARLFGPAGRVFIVTGAGISMLGHVSGMTLSIPRAVFAFARDGFLPRAVADLHPRFHTPHAAIALQSVIACVLAVTSTFDRLAIFATTALLCLYGACCAAAWELRRRDVRAGGLPFRVPGGRLAPPAAGLAIAWMLTSVTAIEWVALAAVLGAASLVFVLTARTRAERAGRIGPSL